MFGVRAALGAGLVVTAVGGVATAVDGDWDLFSLFALVLVCLVGIGIALFGPRRLTSLRSDLARWADQRSAVTGEPASRIIDRSVAAYRDALVERDD